MPRAISIMLAASSIALAACSDAIVSPEAPADAGVSPEPGVSAGVVTRVFVDGEKQPLVELKRGFTYAIYPSGVGQTLIQTFTPTDKQWLGYIDLAVGCSAGVFLEIRVREGIGGPVIAAATATGLPTIVDGTFTRLQVYDMLIDPRGVKLKQDRTYAIELEAFPTAGAAGNTCGLAPGPGGDSYARGDGYYEDIPINGPGYLPLGEDLPFVTRVR